MVNNYNNINKASNHHFPHAIYKKPWHGIGNPDPVLGQTQKCGRFKLVYGIPTPTPPSDNWITNNNTDINKK